MAVFQLPGMAVRAAATIIDNVLVRGDGNAKGVQGSGISIDDSDNISGVGTLGVSGAITSTLATGTAPLVVSSTTEVANLRVERASGLATSATAPASPAVGDVYYDTADSELYAWDSTRSKWLSLNLEFFDGGLTTAPSSGDVLMSSFGRVQGHATRGWIPPHAGITIVGMQGVVKNTFTGNMTLRENAANTTVAILFSSATESTDMSKDYNYDVTKHMSVTINITSGTPSNPVCRVYYRRRKV